MAFCRFLMLKGKAVQLGTLEVETQGDGFARQRRHICLAVEGDHMPEVVSGKRIGRCKSFQGPAGGVAQLHDDATIPR